jgi:AraC-like DNA-binding protein
MDIANKFINNSNITHLPTIRILVCNRSKVSNWRNASPVRPHWRFYWNPEPGAVVSDEYNKYFLDQDFILAIPPGIKVRQEILTPAESIYIHADIDLPLDNTNLRLLKLPIDSGLKESVKRLAESLDHPLVAGEFIYAVISRLPENIWRQQVTDTRIELVCHLLREHPEKNWSNQGLAQKANFSENAFIRRFREVIGVPPQRYLLKLRLNRAAALLLENELSIDEIALSCGFCDRNYLSKMFRKHFGLPPGRFRAGINAP